jgi:2-dehydropantoate 2-reductase
MSQDAEGTAGPPLASRPHSGFRWGAAAPVVGVIGAGAVGCYYGGRLARADIQVHFLAHSNHDALAVNGLTVRSIDGDFAIPVRVHRDVASLPRLDLALVALKGTSVAAIETLLPPLMNDRFAVACLMNGLGNEERIAALVGAERTIAGSAFICSEETAPGVVAHTAAGGLAFAPFSASPTPGLVTPEILAALFTGAGVSCRVEANPKTLKWSKLVWNVPFNGLSVHYGGMTTDLILSDPERTAFARALMEEVIAAGRADGAVLDDALIEKNLRATPPMGAYRTSMMVDFVKGRPIEFESILVEPWRRGRAANLELPAMTRLLDGVRRRLAMKT